MSEVTPRKELWSKFYWNDWRSDPQLRICGLAARGLWVEMLGLMHQATPCGHLLINGSAPTDQRLAVMVGATVPEVRKLKRELEEAGVPDVIDGVWISRRMVRDMLRRDVNRGTGALGGNPKLTTGYDRPGFVYAIRRGQNGPIKIGASADPPKRLYKIKQQYSGERLEIIETAPSQHMGETEAELHAAFAHCQKGEWFTLTSDEEANLIARMLRLKANGKGESEDLLKSRDARDLEARSQKPEAAATALGDHRDLAARAAEVSDALKAICGTDENRSPAWAVIAPIVGWLQAGADPDLDIYPAARGVMLRESAKRRPPGSPAYLTAAVMDALAARSGSGLSLPASAPAAPPDPVREAAAKLFNTAMDAWIAGGRAGPMPELESYLPKREAA